MARYVKINMVLEWLKIIAEAKSYTVKRALCYEYAKILRNNQRIAGFTSDVIEVVRCKDCKFNKIMDDGETYACIRQTAYRKPTDFCSYGERKEDR